MMKGVLNNFAQFFGCFQNPNIKNEMIFKSKNKFFFFNFLKQKKSFTELISKREDSTIVFSEKDFNVEKKKNEKFSFNIQRNL